MGWGGIGLGGVVWRRGGWGEVVVNILLLGSVASGFVCLVFAFCSLRFCASRICINISRVIDLLCLSIVLRLFPLCFSCLGYLVIKKKYICIFSLSPAPCYVQHSGHGGSRVRRVSSGRRLDEGGARCYRARQLLHRQVSGEKGGDGGGGRGRREEGGQRGKQRKEQGREDRSRGVRGGGEGRSGRGGEKA